MKIAIFCSVLLLVLIVCIVILFWSTHVQMCKDEHCPYGYGDFKKFMREFIKYNKWETDPKFEGSFFGADKDYLTYYIHAYIIKFNGKCMILYPWSYIRFDRWRKNEWKKRMNFSKQEEKIKW